MAARTKTITVVEATTDAPLTNIKSFTLTAGRTTCKYIDANNVDELVSLLHNEAKVI